MFIFYVCEYPKSVKSMTLCSDDFEGGKCVFMNKILDNLNIMFPSVISLKLLNNLFEGNVFV